MTRAALVTLCAALLVTGCGGGSDKSSASASGKKGGKDEAAMKKDSTAKSNDAMSAAKGTTVRFVSSEFGKIAADKRGQAVYLFAKEKSKRSRCYGECATKWPPVLTKGKPRAGKGARAKLLGTTRRRGGKLQVTYAGHPLYYFESDSPGKVLCNNVTEFGGLWLVVGANGKPASA